MPETLKPFNAFFAYLAVRAGAFALLVFGSLASATPLDEERVQTRLNWTPLKQIAKSERDERCLKCRGKYTDPLADVDRSISPNESDLEVGAGDSDITDDTLFFSDAVTVTQGYRTLKAEAVTIDRVEQTVTATGPIEVREPGIVMYGDTISYNSIDEQAQLTNAEFVLYEQQLYGIAEEVTRDANGTLTIDEGELTFCSPTDPSWLVSAESLEIDAITNTGEAWGARIDIKGVPILYLPWIQFPLSDQRKTGLLFPDISSDTRGGLDVTAPIYFNLAANYDATYSPRHIADRGFVHQLNARYLGEKAGYWDITGAYLNDDKLSSAPGKDSRWLLNIKQTSTTSSRLRTSIDFSKISDNDYLKDLENNTLSAQRQTALLQQARVDWLADNWLLGVEAQQFQGIAEDLTDNYQRLPQVSAIWRGDRTLGPLVPIVNIQAANFDTDFEKVRGQRLFHEVGVSLPISRSYGFLNTQVSHRGIQYRLKDPGAVETRDERVESWVASIDGSLTFERSSDFFGRSFTQTLEPRAHFLYASHDNHSGIPDFDSAELTFSYRQLFRNTRFSGHDRLADANQLALGLTSRLIDPKTGLERVSLSVGQIFNFTDQRIRLREGDAALTEDGSALALALDMTASERWSVHSNLLFDAYDKALDAANIRISYQPADNAIFNIGYTLREPPESVAARPVTEQFNTSAYIPLDENWRVFGALRYSLEIDSSVEDMIGVEYDGCCWRARFLYVSYLDALRDTNVFIPDPELRRDRAFQFQFVLKGLGSFGRRVDNLMQDMIRGFNATR